jgi:ABC-type nitrate/sulfonate/bicarbonate transport system substrate-binding protein
MDRVRVVIPTLALALAVALALGACGDDDGSTGEPKDTGARTLKIGSSFSPDIGDAADELGYKELERKGISITESELGRGPSAIGGIVRGDVDIAKLTPSDAMPAIAGGADILAILATGTIDDQVLVGREGTTRVAQLRGKRVVTSSPGVRERGLLRFLEANGLSKDDLKVIHLPDSSARAAALERGRAEAATLDFSEAERLRGTLELNTLAEASDLDQTHGTPVLIVSRDFAAQNRELLSELVETMLDTYETTYTPAGRRAWLKQAQALAPDDPSSVLEATYDFQRRIGYWPRRTRPITAAQHAETNEVMIKAGLLDEPLPLEKLWDLSFWRAAAGK